VTWAELEVPTGIAALIVATEPVWLTVFDWTLFKGPRPTPRTWLGVVMGLLGIAILVGPQLLAGAGEVNLAYWIVMIMAPILWGFGSLLSRTADLPKNIFMSTSIEMLAGGLALLLIGLSTGETSQLVVADISARSWAAFIYLIIFGSIIAFTAYIWLLQNVQATRVGTYSFVNPVIAVVLGWLILGEPLSARMLVAAAVIVVAVILIIRQKGKKLEEVAPEAALPVRPMTVGQPNE
jgi:drug/metabolite transporter (DMT)-like permease